MGNDYRIASVADSQSVKPTKALGVGLELERIQAMDFASRENSLLKRIPATNRKSVRFTASTESNRSTSPTRISILSTDADHQKHDFIRDRNTPTPAEPSQQTELLMPVSYSPPSEGESGSEHSTLSDDSWDSLSHSAGFETQYAIPENDAGRTKSVDLTVDTNASRKHTRNTSSISRRGRRDSHQFEIYFTPTDYTRSQIFLSSPVGSPELPLQEPEDECLTPKASLSRPPSAIFIGSESTTPSPESGTKEQLVITSSQLDQLIQALARSQLIQRHVRKQWWDSTDIPDDESMFSASSASLSESNLVSTIYSRPNETFLRNGDRDQNFNHPYAKRALPVPPVPFGGIALLDSKIHGSPVRYTSRNYRQGSKILGIGSYTSLNIPYGTDVECTLRVEPTSPFNNKCKVMLQAVNQAVDRKTSKRAYLLAADVDVTDLFAKAALTELAEATGKTCDDIIVEKPLNMTPDESSIDWCALADEMQNTADTALVIDSAVQNFSALKSETCAMRTLALMSELERIKDQHMDFLIIVPTRFHANGMPSNMRMPWVSQRLYNDWYGTKDGPGFSQTAKDFQQSIVANVAKRAMAKERFTVSIAWKEDQQVVHCVPLMDRVQGEGAAWACFIRGEFDLQS